MESPTNLKKNLKKLYTQKKDLIKKSLLRFQNLSEEKKKKEFLFCLLTPQSKAQRCWQAIEELEKLEKLELERVREILKTKTRFHNKKSERIINSKETYNQINPLLREKNKVELRNKIKNMVNGYGLKEASHFLRNIGLSDNKIAILDRHILKNLFQIGIIDNEKIKGDKHYLEIEKKFLKFSEEINIPADELDLLLWSKENGEIFK